MLGSGDPDSFIREKGRDVFEKEVKGAISLIDYHFKYVFSRHDPRTDEGKSKIASELLDIIGKFKSDIQRNLYFKKLAERLQLDEKSVRGEFERKLKKYVKRSSGTNEGEPGVSREESQTEALLLGVMLEDNNYINVVKEAVGIEGFQTPQYKKITAKIFEIFEKTGSVNPDVLIDFLDGEEDINSISRFSMDTEKHQGTTQENKEKIVNDCIKKIKCLNVARKKKDLEAELKKAEKEGRTDIINSLLTEYQELEKCIRGLKGVD